MGGSLAGEGPKLGAKYLEGRITCFGLLRRAHTAHAKVHSLPLPRDDAGAPAPGGARTRLPR